MIQDMTDTCWTFRDKLMMIDGVAMKECKLYIKASIQLSARGELHTKQIGIEKTRLLG